DLPIGARVLAQGKVGIVRFTGTTEFSAGRWVGVELDGPHGKNDGSVQGVRYFTCRENYGIFVPARTVKPVNDSSNSSNDGINASNQGRSRLSMGPFDPSGSAAMAAAAVGRRTTTAGFMRPAAAANAAGGSPFPADKRRSVIAPPSARATPSPLISTQVMTSSPSEQPAKPAEVEAVTNASEAEVPSTPKGPSAAELEARSLAAMPTPQFTTPAFSGNASVRMNQSVPLKDYDELRTKLRILESKRAEDRQRLKETEVMRAEADQFLRVRDRLTEKVQELQHELRDAKRTTQSLQLEKEDLENKYNEAVDLNEVASLDKEVAEERVINLEQETNLMKERINELEADLDVYKKAVGDASDTISGGVEMSAHDKLERVQLERHNARLKEALAAYRDLKEEKEAEYLRRIKTLEADTANIPKFNEQIGTLREERDTLMAQVEDLKQRLDDAMASEDLLEDLGQRNMELTEQVEQMRATVEDLEELRELNEELEETHVETQRELMAELDHKDTQIRASQQRLDAAAEQLADYERTVSQFRTLVSNLQADIEQLRSREQEQQSEVRALASQSQAMQALKHQLQSTTAKAQAKAIDLELRRLDSEQATEHLQLVEPYLPELFYKSESDAIHTLLLFKRVAFKSDLLLRHLSDYNDSQKDNVSAVVTDSFAQFAQACSMLANMADQARLFVAQASNSTDGEFVRIGLLRPEIAAVERRIAGIIEVLRTSSTSDLRASDTLLDVQRAHSQLNALMVVPTGAAPTPSTSLDGSQSQSQSQSQSDSDDGTLAADALNGSQSDLAGMTTFSDDDMAAVRLSFFTPLDAVINQCKSLKATAAKIKRKADENKDNGTMVSSALVPEFLTLASTLTTNVTAFIEEVRRQLTAYIADRKSNASLLELNRIKSIIANAAERHLQTENEPAMWQAAMRVVQQMVQDSGRLNVSLDSADPTRGSGSPSPPWTKRAQAFKAALVQNTEVERRVQTLNEEITALVRTSRLKENEIQESAVRIELLESKVAQAAKQLDEIRALEDKLAKSKDQEKAYEAAIDTLNADLNKMDLEKQRLMKAVSRYEKAASAAQATANAASAAAVAGAGGAELIRRVEALQSALRYLRIENAQLK
ncbi:hypothetical protein GQ42DRAFT_111903, partial [Ramicandelaber brevisporus]